MDRRLFGRILAIIVTIDDGLVLILPIDKVEVVFAIRVGLDRSI